jgi:SAM-dependent methyltransferase
MSLPALQTTVLDLIEEYDGKAARLADEIAALSAAHDRLTMAASVQGAFVDTIVRDPHLHESTLQKLLLSSGWKAVYNRLQIDRIASAKDKKLFEQTIAAPPPLTFDNAKATFGDYLVRPRFHILRGLAETFADLDPAYKSHSKVCIGVKGLPKRIILTGWGEYGYGYGVDRFKNIVNALATYQGRPHIDWNELSTIHGWHKSGQDAVLDGKTVTWAEKAEAGAEPQEVGIDRGMTVRRFQNGNAHIFFDKWTLLDINRALAEFYGEVLPDAEEDDVKPSASTAVSKDLQFYWTPGEVAEAALEYAGLHELTQYTRSRGYEAAQVLEPSCGDGRILDAIRQLGHRSLGVEYHPGRATQARAKGHNVLSANFLEQPPKPEFDYVVMNPPFYGRHYVKHVRHAFEFLKPGGTLVSILPATAHYDHGELSGDWRDLPVGSFSAAGTNVPTGMLKMRKAA